MTSNPKAAFFDNIADRWDSWEDLDRLAVKLATGLNDMGIDGDETVLDIGCGTGNLTLALLERLSPSGRVVAIDFSSRMIAEAQRKVSDARVDWYIADALNIPVADSSFDRIICFSIWPHFDDPIAVMREFFRLLRYDGSLHVWHLCSREVVNQIHASAGVAVRNDLLQPVQETAYLIERHGFDLVQYMEDEQQYLISALKSAK